MSINIKQIKYNVENFKSRIPGLFTYIEDGIIYDGASSPQGCYDKYVCDLRIHKDSFYIPLIEEDVFGNLQFETVQVDNNFNHTITIPKFVENKNILWSQNQQGEYIDYSYRTLIDIYHKYKVIRNIVKQKYYKRYNNKDITDKINNINDYLDFIDRGIGYFSIESLIKEFNENKKSSEDIFFDEEIHYLVPSGIYVSTAYAMLEEMKILQQSCVIYNDLKENKNIDDISQYGEFCCNCDKFHAMGGDNMIKLLEFCSEIAQIIAEEYYNYSNKQLNFTINTTLLSTSNEMGVFTQNRQIWEAGKEYYRGETVFYDGETYLCLGNGSYKLYKDNSKQNQLDIKNAIKYYYKITSDDELYDVNGNIINKNNLSIIKENNNATITYKIYCNESGYVDSVHSKLYNEDGVIKTIETDKGYYYYDISTVKKLYDENGKEINKILFTDSIVRCDEDGEIYKPSTGYYDKDDDVIRFPYNIVGITNHFVKMKDIGTNKITDSTIYTHNEISLKNILGGTCFSKNKKLLDANGNYLTAQEGDSGWYYEIIDEDGNKTQIKCDKDGIVDVPFLSGRTSSRLRSLRRFRAYLENGIEQRPDKLNDWLFYYRVGLVRNVKMTDKLGNIVRIDEELDYVTDEECKSNYYIYGDIITSIKLFRDGVEISNDDLYNIHPDEGDITSTFKIQFNYVINAHLNIGKISHTTDEDGNVLYIYDEFSIDETSDNGLYHGIKYQETYDVTKDSDLEKLIKEGDYFLIQENFTKTLKKNGIQPDGESNNKIYVTMKELIDSSYKFDTTFNNPFQKEKDENGEDVNNGFIKCMFTFGDYINGPNIKYETKGEDKRILDFKIPDTKKYEFSVLKNLNNYEIKTSKGSVVIEELVSDFITNIDYTVDYEYNNLYKEDYLIGIHYQPYVRHEVNIERGNGDAFEKHFKMMEVRTMQDLENYQNGGFFRIEKMN